MTTPTLTETFPGFGDHAPLDLGDVSGVLRFATDARKSGTFRQALDGFADDLARVGNCSHPVRLRGWTMTIDTAADRMTGHLGDEDHHVDVLTACGNRREDKCPACARIYARDTFELVRTGALGGKTVPATVRDNPLLFVTLTAPSFGYVHAHRENERGQVLPCRPQGKGKVCKHGRPLWCWTKHTEDDTRLGSPLCWDCYDWDTAVVWQHHSTELWRRFTIALRRGIAAALGVGERPTKHRLGLADVAALQYVKVAEFQTRGLVHFHSLVRLDGPAGPGSPAPMDAATLEEQVRAAVRAVEVDAVPVDSADELRTLAFGEQCDVQIVRTGLPGHGDPHSGDLRAEQAAAYLAKYATKSTGADVSQTRPHLERLEKAALDLADRWETQGRAWAGFDGDDDGPYDRLRKWAHMLGFRGHFSTKSRAYSVTLGRLRRARARFARLRATAQATGHKLDTRDLEARLMADDEDTTLVVSALEFQGQGWRTNGQRALAVAAAARAREYAQWKAAHKYAGKAA